MGCRYRLSYFCLSSSAGSIGTSLASQSSILNNAFSYYLPANLVRFFSSFFWKRSLLFPSFSFCGLFLICTRMLSSSTSQHSKAQSPLHKTKQAHADQSATAQARWQSWRELACRRAFYSSLHSLNEHRYRNLRKTTTTHKAAEASIARDVRQTCRYFQSRKDILRSIQHCSFSVLSVYFVHAYCVRVVFVEHVALGFFQLVSLHRNSWTSLSSSFFLYFVLQLLREQA